MSNKQNNTNLELGNPASMKTQTTNIIILNTATMVIIIITTVITTITVLPSARRTAMR